VGPVAYKLELPSHAKIHDVFHCSLLKLYKGPIPPHILQLPPDSIDNSPVVSPLVILDTRIVDTAGVPCKQVLVQWNGLPPEDTSWELWDDLKQHYNLEDKVVSDGVGNVMSPVPIDTNVGIGPVATAEDGSVNDTVRRPMRTKKLPSKYKDHIVYK
ncbi:hypothetical protein KIW84_025066, partial [Lathyrus oleraceus]